MLIYCDLGQKGPKLNSRPGYIHDFKVCYIFLVFSIFARTPPGKASRLQNMQLRFEENIEQNRL